MVNQNVQEIPCLSGLIAIKELAGGSADCSA